MACLKTEVIRALGMMGSEAGKKDPTWLAREFLFHFIGTKVHGSFLKILESLSKQY